MPELSEELDDVSWYHCCLFHSKRPPAPDAKASHIGHLKRLHATFASMNIFPLLLATHVIHVLQRSLMVGVLSVLIQRVTLISIGLGL